MSDNPGNGIDGSIISEYNLLDRLFFNGDRVYVNAAWWRQPAP